MPSGVDPRGSQYSSCETLSDETKSNDDKSSENGDVNGNCRPNRKVSTDHTEYVQKARITKANPPKPALNPMQFVQVKPSTLSQNAQEQLKRAEEIKKVKEVKKEEPEDWQSNLDNWKSSRRKRVEHIIERVVEVKKQEEEEYDRNRRKSKTFSEIMEERGSRRKLSALPIYNDDDANDLSELGLGLAAKSDRNGEISDNSSEDNQEVFQPPLKAIAPNSNLHSTALIKDVIHKKSMQSKPIQPVQSVQAMKPEFNEYDEFGDEHQFNAFGKNGDNKETRATELSASICTMSISTIKTASEPSSYSYEDAIEDYKTRVSRAGNSTLSQQDNSPNVKLDLPRGDILKRRELFEKEASPVKIENQNKVGEVASIKSRISSLKTNMATVTLPTPPSPSRIVEQKLKDRVSSLQNSVLEEVKKPVEIQLKRDEFEFRQQQFLQPSNGPSMVPKPISDDDTDREDSGITTDVSCSQSQADEQTDQQLDDLNQIALKSELEEAVDPEEAMEQNEDDASVLEEALEMAFQLIDSEDGMITTTTTFTSPNHQFNGGYANQPIYENVEEALQEEIVPKLPATVEPYYQVPKKIKEPHYEIPKNISIPLYENVELLFSNSQGMCEQEWKHDDDYGVDDGNELVFPVEQSQYLILEPPKEKPPPPPCDLEEPQSLQNIDNNFKRINSTKRIKKEIRNKRSSFLGIEGNDDFSLELSVAPPPDMAALLMEEKRLEKEMYQKVGLYQNSDNGESRDSCYLSDNHSRQSSEPSSTSSEEAMQDNSLPRERRCNSYSINEPEDDRIKTLEDQIREQESYCNFRYTHHQAQGVIGGDYYNDEQSEEVLRVERELLQLEKEELKRQRENLILRKNIARRELDEGVKMMISGNQPTLNRLSLQELNSSEIAQHGQHTEHYENLQHHQNVYQQQQNYNEYRKSMPNLQNIQENATFHQQQNQYMMQQQPPLPPLPQVSYVYPNESSHRSHQHQQSLQQNIQNNHQNQNQSYGMSRHALHAISAVPKPKLTNDWVQYRKSEPVKQSLNSHWLIQEAEQRRIEQMNNVRSKNIANTGKNGNKKPLPDSVIQTLTQRAQNMGMGEKKRQFDIRSSSSAMDPLLMMKQPSAITLNNNVMHNPLSPPVQPSFEVPQDKVLSVSGKKKCSYCTRELVHGAAMIIENLGLFYHIDCFKCSICFIQLGDGLNGTDVRVRNNKLHCHNCFSSDDGIKFSCV